MNLWLSHMSFIDLLSIILAVLSIVISFALAILGFRYSEKGNQSLAKVEQSMDLFRNFLFEELRRSREQSREDYQSVLTKMLQIIEQDKTHGKNKKDANSSERALQELKQNLYRAGQSSARSQSKKTGS